MDGNTHAILSIRQTMNRKLKTNAPLVITLLAWLDPSAPHDIATLGAMKVSLGMVCVVVLAVMAAIYIGRIVRRQLKAREQRAVAERLENQALHHRVSALEFSKENQRRQPRQRRGPVRRPRGFEAPSTNKRSRAGGASEHPRR